MHSDPVWRILFHFVITVVLVAASVGFAVGIGLIVSSARTLRVFQVMNRWVSTRGAFRALDVPRSTEQFSHRHRRWVGGALIVGGLFATFGLIAGFDAAAIGVVFGKREMGPLIAIVASALRWFLLVGSVAGVAIGAILCFSPGALAVLERHANRWFSARRVLQGGDDMRLTLDRLVASHPGMSGWILSCTSLGAVAYAAALLLARS